MKLKNTFLALVFCLMLALSTFADDGETGIGTKFENPCPPESECQATTNNNDATTNALAEAFSQILTALTGK